MTFIIISFGAGGIPATVKKIRYPSGAQEWRSSVAWQVPVKGVITNNFHRLEGTRNAFRSRARITNRFYLILVVPQKSRGVMDA